METLTEKLDRIDAKKSQGNWIPACGGTEVPFVTRSGVILQYLYQPSTGNHAYINTQTDLFLTDEEAWNLLGK